eukprot:9092565-Alexandrium_andersonii.AAC.1
MMRRSEPAPTPKRRLGPRWAKAETSHSRRARLQPNRPTGRRVLCPGFGIDYNLAELRIRVL